MRFGKKLLKNEGTTVYGILLPDGTLREQFATNPNCCGVSDVKQGLIHKGLIKPITKEEMYDAFTFDEVRHHPSGDGYALTWEQIQRDYPIDPDREGVS